MFDRNATTPALTFRPSPPPLPHPLSFPAEPPARAPKNTASMNMPTTPSMTEKLTLSSWLKMTARQVPCLPRGASQSNPLPPRYHPGGALAAAPPPTIPSTSTFHSTRPPHSPDTRDGDTASDDDETAEQKRLRVAREYIAEMRRSAPIDDPDHDDDRPPHADDDAALGDRLRRAADLESGAVFRRIADAAGATCASSSGRLLRGHRLSVTGVALSPDATAAYSVGKDGCIFHYDVESGVRSAFPSPSREVLKSGGIGANGSGIVTGAPWMTAPARRGGSATSLLCCAASSDGTLLAVAGGAKHILLYDIRSMTCVGAFPGHKDAITGLAFRPGSQDLYSCAMDRAVKLWSAGGRAYVDSLFGHQQEATCIDATRGERLVTGGMDRTVRFWKIPEESQLVFRARSLVTESVAFVTNSQWIAGDQDGNLCLYTNTQKKAIATYRGVHGHGGLLDGGGTSSRSGSETEGDDEDRDGIEQAGGGDRTSAFRDPCGTWVTAVGAARGTDLVASGGGNGVIRLWRAEGQPGMGGVKGLAAVGELPARGFVNAIAMGGGDGRVVVAAMGQEPRLGRWARDAGARNGVLIHRWGVDDEGESTDDDEE